jgi:hypothetical protein
VHTLYVTTVLIATLIFIFHISYYNKFQPHSATILLKLLHCHLSIPRVNALLFLILKSIKLLIQAQCIWLSGVRVLFVAVLCGYCHVLGVCVTYKTGFGFDDRISWTFIQLFQLNCQLLVASRYTASDRTTQQTHPLPSNGCPLLFRIRCRGMCLLSRCLAIGLCVTVSTPC